MAYILVIRFGQPGEYHFVGEAIASLEEARARMADSALDCVIKDALFGRLIDYRIGGRWKDAL